MDKFLNKYRIPSARLKGWDYRWNAMYFITICTKNREHYFGYIESGNMVLSPLGILADIMWHETKFHSPCVQLGEFIVMPNHLHGILILTDNDDGCDGRDVACNVSTIADRNVSTIADRNVNSIADRNINSFNDGNDDFNTVPHSAKNESMAAISPKPDSLSTIIRSYKSAVTKHAHRLGFGFEWQTRFHDHIIRTDEEFERIADYIITNPISWEKDTFNQ